MAHMKRLSSHPRQINRRPFHVRSWTLALSSILLLALAVAACSSQTPPPTANGIPGKGGADQFWTDIANKARDGGATAAIAWAESFEAGQKNAGLSAKYSGLCLEFVANAYGASFSTPYDTAWAMAKASTLNNSDDPAAAPRGALMFFDLTSQKIPEGHVGISLGNGDMISALTHSSPGTTNVRITKIVKSDSYWFSTYRGWAWPPASWGPLAQQAADPNEGDGGGQKLPGPFVHVQETYLFGDVPLYGIFLYSFPPNADIPVTCYDSSHPAGFQSYMMHTDRDGFDDSAGQCTVTESEPDHWVVAIAPGIGGVESNHFGRDGAGHWEMPGGVVHTWTDYVHAGGQQGPLISGQMVEVACRVMGFKVADGNPWWYRIAEMPWDNVYYASADAFYNNGATSGSLNNTPLVDTLVPLCSTPTQGPTVTSAPPRPTVSPSPRPVTPTRPTVTPAPPTVTPTTPPVPHTYSETTGSVTHTWTNYSNAGGTEGPTINASQTVQIACKITGFKVADGNTWWYRIASSPWNNAFYASADAFYNNGQTSGSLQGTPWVDPNVPNC